MADTQERRKQLAAFLKNKYEEYRSKMVSQGRQAPSQKDYALKVIGLDSDANFSQWSTGGRLPATLTDIDLLAAACGPEIYEIMGIAPRMPKDKRLKSIATLWPRLTDAQRSELEERAENMLERKVNQTSTA